MPKVSRQDWPLNFRGISSFYQFSYANFAEIPDYIKREVRYLQNSTAVVQIGGYPSNWMSRCTASSQNSSFFFFSSFSFYFAFFFIFLFSLRLLLRFSLLLSPFLHFSLILSFFPQEHRDHLNKCSTRLDSQLNSDKSVHFVTKYEVTANKFNRNRSFLLSVAFSKSIAPVSLSIWRISLVIEVLNKRPAPNSSIAIPIKCYYSYLLY